MVSVATRLAKTVIDTAKAVSNDGGFVSSMLAGLEHNGLSRPLAGLAQVLQGASTTSKGSLIAAHSDLFSVATASRIIGARPMDESIALNHLFRMNAYKANDMARLESLGTAVKQRIREGNLQSDDILNFAGDYAAVGGRIENYSATMQRWFQQAKESDVNRLMEANKSVRGQRLNEVMGADPLADFARPQE
jgi:hypothetical protein